MIRIASKFLESIEHTYILEPIQDFHLTERLLHVLQFLFNAVHIFGEMSDLAHLTKIFNSKEFE
jgi:hypothetical protein